MEKSTVGCHRDPLMFLIYINDLYSVSNYCFSILFADDTNLFTTGKEIEIMWERLNDDLEQIREWLCCNKLSLNVLKTHYMIFAPRNKIVFDVDIQINCVSIERVYCSKSLASLSTQKFSWKNHIDCVGILCKAMKKLPKPPLINLYYRYSFAYPCMIYCNHVWGNNYPSNLKKKRKVSKRLVRTITCSPYRAHTDPLFLANRLFNVNGINDYVIGIFMYNYLLGDTPIVFAVYFIRNRDIHHHETRGSVDLNVPYGRLDIRKFSLKISGAKLWNSLPGYVKESNYLVSFKKQLKNYLIDRNIGCWICPIS